jgi:hypothetical protein
MANIPRTAMRARAVKLTAGGTDFSNFFSPLKTWAFRRLGGKNVPFPFAKTVTSHVRVRRLMFFRPSLSDTGETPMALMAKMAVS